MPFNSDRKRMSVVVYDPDDKKIKLYCKGADTIINARLDSKLDFYGSPKRIVEPFLEKSSKLGYRTLVMAMK